MKNLLSGLLVLLVVILFGVTAATPAQATSTISISVSVAKAAPTFVTKSVTPVTSAPRVIGGGVIKPLWLTVSCYWAINGGYYCWRYGCTQWETWFYGCTTGWYRANSTWYA